LILQLLVVDQEDMLVLLKLLKKD